MILEDITTVWSKGKVGHQWESAEVRLFRGLVLDRASGCWVWTRGVQRRGYGIMRVADHTQLAHRVSWALHFGAIPGGLCVCHRCDNPPCCNPDHLFLGTLADNNADREAKGRQVVLRGTQNGRSKLTESQVREILRIGESMECREVGRMFGVSGSVVCAIRKGKLWRHVKVSQ